MSEQPRAHAFWLGICTVLLQRWSRHRLGGSVMQTAWTWSLSPVKWDQANHIYSATPKPADCNAVLKLLRFKLAAWKPKALRILLQQTSCTLLIWHRVMPLRRKSPAPTNSCEKHGAVAWRKGRCCILACSGHWKLTGPTSKCRGTDWAFPNLPMLLSQHPAFACFHDKHLFQSPYGRKGHDSSSYNRTQQGNEPGNVSLHTQSYRHAQITPPIQSRYISIWCHTGSKKGDFLPIQLLVRDTDA